MLLGASSVLSTLNLVMRPAAVSLQRFSRPISNQAVIMTKYYLPCCTACTVRWSGCNTQVTRSLCQPNYVSWIKTNLSPVQNHNSLAFNFNPDPVVGVAYECGSVLKKRRSKMNKHKYKKLRKRTKFLRRKLGK